jgi:uncharacterized protein (TIGR02172 family)
MTIKLGEKIGEGGCSEVFEINNNQIIKLAKTNTGSEAVRREFYNSCAAYGCGLPVPQPFEFVEMDGRPGIIFERIKGETILERFFKQIVLNKTNEIDETDIRLTAQHLSNVHKNNCVGHELLSQRSVIKSNIMSVNYLSPHEKEAVISLVDILPSPKQYLCHGDPNPGNFIIKKDGNAVLIDWMNATIGNPEADIAEYIIMIRYAVLPPGSPVNIINLFDSIRENIISIFMDEYRKLTGITYDDVSPWITPIAARKLSADAISELEKKKLVQEIRRTLKVNKYE